MNPVRHVLRLVCAVLIAPAPIHADPVAVRHAEGLVHGFLALRTLDGTTIADGDLLQHARGSRVTTRLVFHFKDGSVQDETTVFEQRQVFELVSDHLVQKGPSFPQPLDVSIDRSSGRVTVRYTDGGEDKVAEERFELPSDVANGLVLTLLKNVGGGPLPSLLPMVAPAAKPRLVKLAISQLGDEAFRTGGRVRKAAHYVVKVQIGGVAGVLAPLLGKQPADTHVWILQGETPAFVKSEGPFYLGGPTWRIELVSPVWNETSRTTGH